MAAAVVKKPCNRCENGGGVITCDGCFQSFCLKHIIEHRQELTIQLENIGQERDLFQRDLTEENTVHPLFARIDAWEQESIAKIQATAEVARADLQQVLERARVELKDLVSKMTSEIQSSRKSDDFTENDLVKWTEELKDLRHLMAAQLNTCRMQNDNIDTSIHMIRICEQQSDHSALVSNKDSHESDSVSQELLPNIYERFGVFFGKIYLSEDGLLATGTGTYWDGSNVYGVNRYSSGFHPIHFRIENKGSNSLFFGITASSTEDFIPHNIASSRVYGWWEDEQAIESITGHRLHSDRSIRTGDEVTMTLDCDKRQIHFHHYRTNRTRHLPVELEKCSFPWKVLVTLRSTDDCVRIIHK